MEETDPGSDKPPLRTASRPPQKAQRDEQWVPSIQRGVPISAGRGPWRSRSPTATCCQGNKEQRNGSCPDNNARAQISVPQAEEKPKGRGKRKRAKENPIKAKGKERKGKESKDMIDHNEERAIVHAAPGCTSQVADRVISRRRVVSSHSGSG